MNFLMTAAPLAMRLCGLSQESANLGLQWHVIAMYAPSFFTGRLITRFGAPRVVAVGLALLAASAVAGLLGQEVGHFWWSLILLGLGWNFGFIGASDRKSVVEGKSVPVRVDRGGRRIIKNNSISHPILTLI